MFRPIYNATLNPDRFMNNAKRFSVSCSCLSVMTGSTGKGAFLPFFMQRQISGCRGSPSPGTGLCPKTIVPLVFFQPRYLRQFPIPRRHSFSSRPVSRYGDRSSTISGQFSFMVLSFWVLYCFQFFRKGCPCSPWNGRYSPAVCKKIPPDRIIGANILIPFRSANFVLL